MLHNITHFLQISETIYQFFLFCIMASLNQLIDFLFFSAQMLLAKIQLKTKKKMNIILHAIN